MIDGGSLQAKWNMWQVGIWFQTFPPVVKIRHLGQSADLAWKPICFPPFCIIHSIQWVNLQTVILLKSIPSVFFHQCFPLLTHASAIG